ncbi:hypothetical protein A5482_002875 [Cyanobacterium sp. IPPAS B-1200]|nr:hypothetical protein [Cyanobacterium sp. IPPAS B-1200]
MVLLSDVTQKYNQFKMVKMLDVHIVFVHVLVRGLGVGQGA